MHIYNLKQKPTQMKTLEILNYTGSVIWTILAAFFVEEIQDIILICSFSIILLILGVTATILRAIKKQTL